MNDIKGLKKLQNSEMRISGTNPPYLYFEHFEKTGLVKNAFSTRLGGVSEGCYSSLNLAIGSADDPAKVMENFRRMAAALDTKTENMIRTRQAHTTNILNVTSRDAGEGFAKKRCFDEVDGLITNEPGLVLVASFADCVPLYFLDPVKKVIALSHSGWRGTAKRMGEVTLKRMKSEYGCRPSDILAGIGPSISRDNYEVSRDVFDSFCESYPEIFMEQIFTRVREGHYLLDLWLANRLIMINAGIKEENIKTAGICTAANSDILFSHRASSGRRGLMCAFLALIYK